MADETSCRALIDRTADRFGRLDILVNNAGTSIRKPPEAYSAAEWHAVLDTNLTGAFLCSQAAHPVMKRDRRGKIINIGSMFALFGSAYAAPYAASKGALVQLTKSLAAAWAADNIQVNAVLPGWIDTELTRDARRQVAGIARAGFGAHAGRPVGRTGRSRRHRRVPGLIRVRFYHRRRDPGRRRLLRDGLAPGSADGRA